MTTSALGRAEKAGLRKVSKATTTMDRRIQHIRQLFSERIARAESEYHAAMRAAIIGEDESSDQGEQTTTDQQNTELHAG